MIYKAIQMMGFCSLLIEFGNLIHRFPMKIGNLLIDFNLAIELFRYRSFISFQLDKIVHKILLKAYHLALSFSTKGIILVLYYFMSFRAVGDVLLSRKRKLDFSKIKLNYSQA